MARVATVKLPRTNQWSSRLRRNGAGTRPSSGGTMSTAMALAPSFQEVDHRQQDEGDGQEDDGDGRRLAVREFFQPGDDQDRGDLCLVRHVAGDEDHRAV